MYERRCSVNDPGSLQNLNDIVVPATVPAWPPAPGVYLLLLVALVIVAWLAVRWIQRWQRNRYRREALRELARVRGSADAATNLPRLLKRAALSAWPRERIAALNGEAWHRFLDQSAGMSRFCDGAGEILDRLAYGGAACTEPEMRLVLDAAETWLRRHRAEAA